MRSVFVVTLSALAGCVAPTMQPSSSGSAATVARVHELLSRLDYDPNPLLSDFTPAVLELSEIGEAAIEPTLPFLFAESEATRLRASRAIDGAMMRTHGYVDGAGWRSPADQRRYESLCAALWNGDETGQQEVRNATFEARREYVVRVKKWLASRRV